MKLNAEFESRINNFVTLIFTPVLPKRKSVIIVKEFFQEIFLAIDGIHEDSTSTIFVFENLAVNNSDNN